MKQKTAQTVEDVLEWIETTPHHRAAWRTKDGRSYAQFDEPDAFLVLDGDGERLRVPVAIHLQTDRLVRPNQDRFDNRMYRATKSGLARLRRARAAKAEGRA